MATRRNRRLVEIPQEERTEEEEKAVQRESQEFFAAAFEKEPAEKERRLGELEVKQAAEQADVEALRELPFKEEERKRRELDLFVSQQRRQRLARSLGAPVEGEAAEQPQAGQLQPPPSASAQAGLRPIEETAPEFGAISPSLVGGRRFNVPQIGLQGRTPAQFVGDVVFLFTELVDKLPLPDQFSPTAKRSPEVTEAQAGMSNALQFLESEIEKVKQGIRDPAAVRADFERFESSINRLEATQLGFGKLNLRYWQGAGITTQQEIIIAKKQHNNLLRELDAAAQQGQLTRDIQRFQAGQA